MEKIVLKVPTIHCEGCVGNVQRVLSGLPGVLAVEGDPQTKEVTVIRQEGTVTDDELAGGITAAGHVVAETRREHEER